MRPGGAGDERGQGRREAGEAERGDRERTRGKRAPRRARADQTNGIERSRGLRRQCHRAVDHPHADAGGGGRGQLDGRGQALGKHAAGRAFEGMRTDERIAAREGGNQAAPDQYRAADAPRRERERDPGAQRGVGELVDQGDHGQRADLDHGGFADAAQQQHQAAAALEGGDGVADRGGEVVGSGHVVT